MCYLIVAVLSFYFPVISCLFPILPKWNNSENYGPYSIEWTEFTQCRAGRTKDFYFDASMIIPEQNNTNETPEPLFHFNISVRAPIQIDTFRLEVYTVVNGKKKLEAYKKFEKPCHSPFFILLPSFQFFKLKDNSKLCILAKMDYVFDLNLSDLTKQIVGQSFFYGHYYARAVSTSKSKTLMCVIIGCKVSKIN